VLPSTFADDGHVLVRLTINGRGLDFLLDSGASSITIDPGVAQQLRLTVSKRDQSSANAGRFMTGAAVVPLMTVGDLTMRGAVVSIVPLGFDFPGEKAVGLLGFDFICESSITIDYEHKTVTAERFGSYAAPEGPHVIALPLRLGSQVPMTSVIINGAIAERMMIDTGAAGPFVLFDYFQRRHPETLPAVRQGVRMNGAGGEFDAHRAQFDAVTIGNVKFAHFVGYLVASRSSYSGDADGVIGPDFLHFFDVHLDYPNGTIYLVPNALGQRSMH
jgi:predicted aspartyl protease